MKTVAQVGQRCSECGGCVPNDDERPQPVDELSDSEWGLRVDKLAVAAGEAEPRHDALECLRFAMCAWLQDPRNAEMLAKLNIEPSSNLALLSTVMSCAAMGAADAVRGCVAIDWPSRRADFIR